MQVPRSNTGIWFGSRSNIKIKYQVSWFGAGIWFTEDPCSGLLGWWHTGGGQPSKFGTTHGFLSKYVHAIAKPDNCSTARSRLLLLRPLLLHAVLLWALGRTGGLWVGVFSKFTQTQTFNVKKTWGYGSSLFQLVSLLFTLLGRFKFQRMTGLRWQKLLVLQCDRDFKPHCKSWRTRKLNLKRRKWRLQFTSS